jgi:uncharacterized protein YdeI (YjbR/CyaY-like superfamily)
MGGFPLVGLGFRAGLRITQMGRSHRKEFVRWVSEAKRDATRAQRVAKTVDMLRAGQHR